MSDFLSLDPSQEDDESPYTTLELIRFKEQFSLIRQRQIFAGIAAVVILGLSRSCSSPARRPLWGFRASSS